MDCLRVSKKLLIDFTRVGRLRKGLVGSGLIGQEGDTETDNVNKTKRVELSTVSVLSLGPED